MATLAVAQGHGELQVTSSFKQGLRFQGECLPPSTPPPTTAVLWSHPIPNDCPVVVICHHAVLTLHSRARVCLVSLNQVPCGPAGAPRSGRGGARTLLTCELCSARYGSVFPYSFLLPYAHLRHHLLA